MPAVDLRQAAYNAYTDMFASWDIAFPTIGTKYTAWVTAFQAIAWDDSKAAQRVVSNWLVLAQRLKTMGPTVGDSPTYTWFEQATRMVYDVCFAGFNSLNAGRITAAQATALLAAYNANFP